MDNTYLDVNGERVKENSGCVVTKRISEEGYGVRFMYRTVPNNPYDSGWSFFSGYSEDGDYGADPSNFHIYDINKVVEQNQEIAPFLDSPVGSVFECHPDTNEWVEVFDYDVTE